MLREIGSNFWIAPEECNKDGALSSPSVFGCAGNDFVWMSTGRSATRLVLQSIEERNPDVSKVALIPAFTCHTVIEPFLDFGYKVFTLPINAHLLTVSDEILDLQEKTNAGVVLFHHYFGFRTILDSKNLVNSLNKRGVVVIEDRTQCLYSSFDVSDSDYYVGSIRKWCGVPDGGFAVCRDGVFSYKPIQTDDRMNAVKIEASLLKYNYIIAGEGEKKAFKSLYREAEELLDNQGDFFSIGGVSSMIQANLDILSLSERRRMNYSVLLNGLKGHPQLIPFFETLPKDSVPLYFPVYAHERNRLQSLLADNDVYAPVVWPKADCCPTINPTAEDIYQHILCVPIDQRYDIDDMERIISIIKHES